MPEKKILKTTECRENGDKAYLMTALREEELDDAAVFAEAVAQSILGHFHRNVEDTQFVSVARFGQQFTYGVGIFHLFLSLESRLYLSV